MDVEDVARGHIVAWRRGNPGERYLLGNWGHHAAGRVVPIGSTHREAAAAADGSVTACVLRRRTWMLCGGGGLASRTLHPVGGCASRAAQNGGGLHKGGLGF